VVGAGHGPHHPRVAGAVLAGDPAGRAAHPPRRLPIRQAAWYFKSWPTFSDALAVVRQQLWHPRIFSHSLPDGDREQNSSPWLAHLLQSLCYTA